MRTDGPARKLAIILFCSFVVVWSGSAAAAVPKVAVGQSHAVALRLDGTLWAWGSNYSGQIGDGTSKTRHTPVRIGNDTDWTDVAAGESHTVALKSDGTLWGWGSNFTGQLGDGTNTDRHSPVQIGNDTRWTAVAAAYDNTVALKSDGTLWAWGWNDFGQLGNGTTIGRITPGQIGTDTNWASVAAGGVNVFAIKTDGTLWACGLNGAGELGDGTTTERHTPVQIGIDTHWISVAAGGSHTLALKSDGTLWAWGWNLYGQLGDGTTIDRHAPVQIGIDAHWISVAAAGYNTVAIKSDGTLWAWGSNVCGQLGDGTTTERHTPVQIGIDAHWISVAAEAYQTIALKSDYTLWAWGSNDAGQLGDGTTTERHTPVQISLIATPLDGGCGNQNGLTLLSAPTAYQSLCSEGVPSEVTGSGPWNWTCAGLGGGSTAACSANLQTWTVTPSAGSNGAISPSAVQTVNNAATASFTVTPATGYTATVGGTCTGSPSGGTTSFTYTTNPVTANCTVTVTFMPPVNGQCGSANGGTFTSAPTVNLCSAGMTSSVTDGWPWNWTCAGSNGGTNASCQANIKSWSVTPSTGSNGAISPNAQQTVNHGTTTSFTITPNAGYTASVGGTCTGSPSGGTAPFTYTTNPVTANCTVAATFTAVPVNGQCGSANNGTFTSSPTSNLCSRGTANTVTGSGPWNWSCIGANGGSTANCSANIQTWTVTSSVTGVNGTISCTSPVNHGLNSTCTITPNKGYRLATLTDNGGDVKAQVVGNVYTIPAVTTNHVVTASFVTRGTTILWRNISTGENTVWYMDGSTHTATATLEPLTGPWRMVATADFNNDGEPDILWRNISTGANMVWYMNGATHTGAADLTPITDQNWKIVGVADFNEDGQPDILWRNISTGANMVWYMNGATHSGSADLTPSTDQNWKIVGTADFNSDGEPDILWRNSVTGQNFIWYMEGITRTGLALLDTVTDPNWKMIVGTIDLNNDRKPDILWRNTATGANMVWYMNGITHTSADLNPVTDQNMEMAGQGNYSAMPPLPANGQCGSSNGGAFTAAPATNLCSAGTAGAVTGAGPWTWTCTGANGGTTASCSANLQIWSVTPSAEGNGAISPSTAQTVTNGAATSFVVTPAAGYTAAVGGTCGGVLIGTAYTTNPITASCSVTATFSPTPVNGQCGSANYTTSCSAPTTNLCSAGTPSAVMGSGPWTWSCQGTNGGANTNCSGNTQMWTVIPSAGSNGTISPKTQQIVCNGTTAPFTVTPAAGFNASVGGTCGGALVGTTYTTNPVTANCTVTATFIALPANGQCGSANGGTATTAPTSNLCGLGTASTVTGAGPWTWTCTGANGGTTASCSANLQTWSDPLDNWHWRNPLPQGNSLRGVAYGNGTFVAVGYGGTILTSPDGITWTQRTSGVTGWLVAVTYGNNIFVAVGYKDTPIARTSTILTSPDGITWTQQVSETGLLDGIAYGNGTFVAVGYDYAAKAGTILTSPDGTTWTQRTSGTTAGLSGVAYGNGTFVAVGNSILISRDGITWTESISGVTGGVCGVAYGNNTFAAVGYGGTIITSRDGITWTQRTSGTTAGLSGVAYGNGTFVAVGNSILISRDGITWTESISGVTGGVCGVAYGNNTFAAVGYGGTIITSRDGITWTQRTSGAMGWLVAVTYGNNTFVAVGSDFPASPNAGVILTSPDGTAWTERTSGVTGWLYGVAYGNNTFAAVGQGGTILTSPDGITWTQRVSGVTGSLEGIAYGNNTFAALGQGGTILTSPDGITWTQRSLGSGWLYGVAYGNGTFVAVGEGSTANTVAILTSPDGITWTQRNSGTPGGYLYGTTYGNGTFVAMGFDRTAGAGIILTSPDGVDWTQRVSGVTGSLEGIAYGNNTFVAVGYDSAAGVGIILTSSDGITWTQRNGGIALEFFGVAYGNNTFVAATTGIIQSDPIGPSPPVNGQCGSANNGTFTQAPSVNLCSAGMASSVIGNGPWTWTCAGSNGGATANCSANVAITPGNGQCGSANNGSFTSAPTSNLCTAGTASAVAGGGPWTWICQGTNGGATANCSANIQTWTVTPSAGGNGTISPSSVQTVNHDTTKSFTVTPNAGYTASAGGTCGGSPPSGTAPFTYTTNPVTANCTVAATFIALPVNGQCGSANGGIFTTPPTINLCNAGTVGPVTGTGPWIWTCQGATTAQCQANLQAWTVTSSVTGGNGTISCTSPVNQGMNAPCTITPNKGYRLATLLDNGSDVTGQVAGNVYTIAAVTTNYVVTASFVTRGTTILWRNISTGENTVWYMDGSTHTATATLEPLTGPWRMVATADFNNDGEPDILWRNISTGANMVWYMNGATHTGAADLTPVTDQNWKIVGVADFNSDGQPDILWRNISTGANMVWYMNGATHTGSADLTPITDQNWRIVGTADFNSDGEPDILWRNSVTGQNFIWYMEGITRTGLVLLDTVTDPNWKMIVGATDLNKDRKPDILWRNTATGENMVWYMNGITHTSVAMLDTVTDQNMEMAGQGNYAPPPPINGLCGSANGGIFAAAPTTNLCTTGTASAVTGSGPWSWSCSGANGGPTVNCSTNLQTWTVTPSAGTGGTISPSSAQTVNDNARTSFIITPNAGHGATVSGTCGGYPPSGTWPFTYTTNPITTDCTVVATFTSLPPSGVCGSADDGIFTSAPATDLCSAGTASEVAGTGPWTWNCQGVNSTAPCLAHIKTWIVTPSAGSNGTIRPNTPWTVNNGQTTWVTVTPSTGYSASFGGTCGGTLTGINYFTGPITIDCTVTVTFTQTVSGVCGSANGGIFAAAPTTNLCSAGTVSTVTGSGPWIWTCQGATSTAQCQANLQAWTVTSSVTGGNGAISCTSPVNDGLVSTCTINASKGYRLATLTDNGSDVLSQVSESMYTIPKVTSNHVVIATFVTRGPFIFWRNISTCENTVWYMNGSTRTGSASLARLIGPWRMVGTADFNSDGEADILWRNTVTGENMVWYMNGTTRTGSADLTPVTDQNWKIVGVADFNSDGNPDIVWRNISTGENMVWYMNGTTRTGSADLTPITDQNWEIVGAADFNSDGNPDIVWRNGATGQNVVWYMEGITRTGLALLDTVTDQNWKMIVGTIDLNKDGKPDILWRNTATGQNTVWYMNGSTHTSADLALVTDQNMEIAGEGNYWVTPLDGNYVYLQSDAGDYVGAGRTYVYTQANALLSVTADKKYLLITIDGDEQWTGRFQTPKSVTQLQSGYYGDLQRYPSLDPAVGSLDWFGEGRGCNTLTGWFAIDNVTYVNGVLTAIDLRFEQHDGGGSPALHGQIHWDSHDPTAPPGPLNPPPAGLWELTPGATPPAGNYVYLQSDAGDFIGQGQTYTYTQANAVLSVTATGGHLSVSVSGNEHWAGDFQTMESINQLQPGYYGNLEGYPFHNPAKGGLDWWGQGRGSNILTGWFVIDKVAYVNGILTAIDFRFEQHSDGASSALHGKIHWSQ